MTEITQLENRKFIEDKEKKLKKEVEKIKTKQDNESSAFQLKMTAAFNEFKKSRAAEYERLIQKFKNKIKDLELQQKTELNTITNKSTQEFFYYLLSFILLIYDFNYFLI